MDVCNLIRKHPVIWWDKGLLMVGYCSSRAPFTISKPLASLLTWILLILLLTFSFSNASEAAGSKVLILKSGSASVYNRVIDAARQRINTICQPQSRKCVKPSISVESIRNNKKLRSVARDKKWDLIITIGSKAAKQLNSYNIQTPTLYSLIPSHNYPSIRSMSASRQKSAIYIDQPIRRQLQLIKSAMPGQNKVGVLLGSYSGIGKQRLQQIIHSMGLKPVVINVTPNNIGSSLEHIYSRTDVLLAQPDPTVYNKKSVMTVLLSSYRHNVPVVGYSAAFVKSGATVAIYSTPKDIGRHIGDEIVKYFSSGNRRLPSPAFPRYFSIDTNRSVVNSLNIKMPSRKTIKSRIMKAR